MIQWTRMLARVGLFVLPIGLGLYLIGSRLVCWNSCPPDAPEQLLPWCLDLLVPGIVAGAGAWVAGLSVLASQRRWRVLCIAFCAPLGTIGAGRLLLVPATGGEFIGPEALAADLMIWTSLVLVVVVAWLRVSFPIQPADQVSDPAVRRGVSDESLRRGTSASAGGPDASPRGMLGSR